VRSRILDTEHLIDYSQAAMSQRFTCRMRLHVTRDQAGALAARFEAARRAYNAVLGEMRRRLDLMRQSRAWQKARKTRRDKAKRAKLFTAARAQHGFSRQEAIRFARALVHAGITGTHLGVHDVDCLAKRAFDAVQRMALGRSRNVRFKSRSRLRSLESDAPDGGIRFRGGQVLWRQADQRPNENGRIANAVVHAGKHLKAEDVSVKGWQKIWGKRIASTAPGGCMARIRRKAESAGGELQTFPTRSTRLSQSCVCGRAASKALSERVHRCPCGVRMQRDLLSAYLANFVDEHGLHADQAQRVWAGAEPHLRAAWSRQQSASSGRGPDARKGRSGSRAQVA
jgi:hypothetical protein